MANISELELHSYSTGHNGVLTTTGTTTWTGVFGKIQALEDSTTVTNITFQDGSTLASFDLNRLETIEAYVSSLTISTGSVIIWRTQ